MIWAVPALAGLMAAPYAQAQDQTAPAFEVASIKPAQPGAKGVSIRRDPAGGLTALNISLRDLILLAHHVQGFQVIGAPDWVRTEHWDVVGRAPAGSNRDETWLKLATLLAERFHLAVHRETKELPIFTLVTAKSGPKIQPAHREPNEADGSFKTGDGHLSGLMIPMEYLAFALGDVLGYRVTDATGISGKFDLQLQWARENDPAGPSIFTVLQEQLGLKLEPGKGRVGVVIVDQVEKPAAN